MTIWIRASSRLRPHFQSPISIHSATSPPRLTNFRFLSTMNSAPYLVTPQELKSELDSSKVVPVDVSWFMPGSERKAAEEFKAKHLPGARYLNLDEVADKNHPLQLKHMMPSPEEFAKACCECCLLLLLSRLAKSNADSGVWDRAGLPCRLVCLCFSLFRFIPCSDNSHEDTTLKASSVLLELCSCSALSGTPTRVL